MSIDSNIKSVPTSDLQQQVDNLADELIARGVRPTPQLLSMRLSSPHPLVRAALETWALRLANPNSGVSESPVIQRAVLFADHLQHGTRLDSTASAAVAAGLEAANRKEEIKRIEWRLELTTEIERARIALGKMEDRCLHGNPPDHLVESINKARARLLRMQAALEETPPASNQQDPK